MLLYPFFHLIKKMYALLVLTILVIAFSACGANNATNTSGAISTSSTVGDMKSSGATVTSSATTIPRAKSLVNLLAPNKDNVASDIDGLHIQESSALHCLNLVLASNRLTYDQGEIQQMSQFLKYSDGIYSSGDSRLIPSTLRWVEGGSNTSSCSATFQITNTGNTTIQISRVGLRIKQTPLPNTYVYRLIYMCSFLPPGGVCGGRGGMPGPCGIYYVNLSLKNAKLNDAIGDTPTAGLDASGNPCPELTLTPRMSTELEISVGGPSFIYSVVPEFSVTTGQGQQVLALPTFTSTVAFSTQFPCYALQGSSLVLMSNPLSECV